MALNAAGAECLYSGEMEVIYFDREDHKIHEANELLRLRRLGEKVELTYKKNLRIEDECKVADEFEVTVSSFEGMREILQSLGFKVAKDYRKIRHHFRQGQVQFVIDEYAGLRPYLEIEAPSNYGIEEWIIDLGLQNKERSTKTFDQLLEDKK